MNTNLLYSGKVKLYLNIGNKTIEINEKNEGTITLHESICRFLAGQYRGNYDIPQYLDIRTQDNVSVLINVIPLSGRTYISDGDNVYTRCDCSVLFSSLISQIVADESVTYKLVLCADKDPEIPDSTYRDLAIVNVSSLSLSRITQGTSAAVEWRLYIYNESE